MSTRGKSKEIIIMIIIIIIIIIIIRGGKSQRGVAKSYTAYRTMQLELYYGRTPQMTLSVG